MSDVAEVEAKESHAVNIHNSLPGQKLKKAREDKNLEQADIAKELRIDLRFVKALEEERFNELPQPVYTSGYVRAYSKLVGLVPEEIVSEYSSHQKAAVTTKPKTDEKEEIPSHYRHVQNSLPKSFSVGHSASDDKKKFNITVAVLALLVVFAIVWQVTNRPVDNLSPATTDTVAADPSGTNEEMVESSAQIDIVTQNKVELPLPKLETKNVEPESVETLAQQSVGSAQESNELVQNAQKITELSLHYSEDSWVDIRDATGKAIIRKLGVAGKSHTVSGVAPFEVLLGYSPGVSIEHDGQPYDLSAYSEKRVARFVLNSDGGVEKSHSQLINIPGSKIERSEPFAVE